MGKFKFFTKNLKYKEINARRNQKVQLLLVYYIYIYITLTLYMRCNVSVNFLFHPSSGAFTFLASLITHNLKIGNRDVYHLNNFHVNMLCI